MFEVKKVFDDIASSTLILYKKDVLAKNAGNEDFKHTLKYLLNPFFITGISSKKIEKQTSKQPTKTFDSFFELMEYLLENNTGTDEIVANIQGFLSAQSGEIVPFLKGIITKSLRLGSDVKTVNKVYGSDFIPKWEVQQSYSLKNVELEPSEWFSLSEKLNGVRGTYYESKILSRQGKEFAGLSHIIGEIEQLPFADMVFDGELVRKNPEGVDDNENFRLGTGILNSDEEDKSAIVFVIFDMLPEEEYRRGESDKAYKARYKDLLKVKQTIEEKGLSSIQIVNVLYQGLDRKQIDHYLTIMDDQGKEGLMLNRDSKYQCKRHNGILKVKKFYSIDLEIIRLEEGAGRLSGVLGAFVVKYKGNELSVGSGISDQQRKEFWESRDQLASRVIEVKYKEESRDKKTGKQSLQFPIFVMLREEGKEESYE